MTHTEMTNDEADAAIETAQAPFETWRRLPFEQRATLLLRTAYLCRERLEDLARLMGMEIEDQISRSVAVAGRIVIGGKRAAPEGAFIEPTILTNAWTGMPAYDEELFGPVASVIAIPDEARAIEIDNETRSGLGGSVDTRDAELGRRVAEQTA